MYTKTVHLQLLDMCQEFFLSGFSMFPYAYHLFFPNKSSTIISTLVLARNDFDFHCFQFWVNWCDSWEWSHSPGPRVFCIITSCAAPGDFESHYRIDQLVLHVQGPIEPAVMKGFGVKILIVYIGSWDEGGMKEAGFFALRAYLLRALWKEDFVTVSPRERFQLRTSSHFTKDEWTNDDLKGHDLKKRIRYSHWHYKDACLGLCPKCGCQDTNLHVTITFFGCLKPPGGEHAQLYLLINFFSPWQWCL